MPIRNAFPSLSVLALLLCGACATPPSVNEESEEEVLAVEEEAAAEPASGPEADATDVPEVPEVPAVAATEGGEPGAARADAVERPQPVPENENRDADSHSRDLGEVVVQAKARHELIHDLVAEARALLQDVQLQYVFTGKGRKETLRGRPVAFALWSESKMEWTVAQVEIPRPPVRWRPGGRPLAFTVRTPGIQARHVKGTGAERLMFSFTRDGEPL